jgi:hypothetical protein
MAGCSPVRGPIRPIHGNRVAAGGQSGRSPTSGVGGSPTGSPVSAGPGSKGPRPWRCRGFSRASGAVAPPPRRALLPLRPPRRAARVGGRPRRRPGPGTPPHVRGLPAAAAGGRAAVLGGDAPRARVAGTGGRRHSTCFPGRTAGAGDVGGHGPGRDRSAIHRPAQASRGSGTAADPRPLPRPPPTHRGDPESGAPCPVRGRFPHNVGGSCSRRGLKRGPCHVLPPIPVARPFRPAPGLPPAPRGPARSPCTRSPGATRARPASSARAPSGPRGSPSRFDGACPAVGREAAGAEADPRGRWFWAPGSLPGRATVGAPAPLLDAEPAPAVLAAVAGVRLLLQR